VRGDELNMKLTKENITKRLRNPKTWIALIALVAFVVENAGKMGFKDFLMNLWNYVYLFGIAIGFWTDHDESKGQKDNE